MASKNQLPQNVYFIKKDSPIRRATDFVDHALDRLTEVQLRCAGTAVQTAILIAEKCVALGIAQYSRFTTQMVPYDGREVLYTIIKLKRVPATNNKAQKVQKKQQKPPVSSNSQKRQQNRQQANRKHSQDQYQPERNRRQAYNDDHRQRNERREQNREGNNNEKGQRNNQRSYNESNRRDNNRDYR